MTVSLRSQIAEVEREIALRRRVYPNLVSTRKMKQAEADLHTQHMEAVLGTLQWLAANESAIKAALRPPVRATDEVS